MEFAYLILTLAHWVASARYCNYVLEGTKVGDSIAVNGICLTVTDMAEGCFSADVMIETIAIIFITVLISR